MMKLPLRIAGSDIGPLDFLSSLASARAQWSSCIVDGSIPRDLDVLHKHFVETWTSIEHSFSARDHVALKRMQSYLSPWPPVALLALDPHHSTAVHTAWLMLLEFHTVARLALEEPALLDCPEWDSWSNSLSRGLSKKAMTFPGSTGKPGIFRTPSTLAVVTTQPLSFSTGKASLQKLTTLHKDALIFRLQTPACGTFDNNHQIAACDLFGAHSARETSKLAFWSMIGTHRDPEASLMLKWRPRYYGGPSGTPSWALHNTDQLSGQAAARSRSAMLDWMTNLSDSLYEQLHQRNDIVWTSAHYDFLRAYTRAWHAVTRIGVAHKRTASQVNELLSYTSSIQEQLARTNNGATPDLAKAIHWASQKLQQRAPRSFDLCYN